MEKHDVIVIGSGPAGVSAAIELKKRGIDCLLIDRHGFPREKTCGGLLTCKSLDLIRSLTGAALPPELIRQTVREVHIENRGEPAVSLHVSQGFGLCHRFELDHWLVQQYLNLGGAFLPETAVRKVDPQARTVLCKNGEVFSYEHLIGADGALSSVRKAMGLPQPVLAMGVETSLPAAETPVDGTKIVLDVGILPDGYVWIFPKQDQMIVGLACTQNKDIHYGQELDDYVRNLCRYSGDYKTKGAYLPYGPGIPSFTADRICLVGDAAGFTEPVTGEGIYYALLSGRRAAQAIADFGPDAEQHYAESCRDIQKQMQSAMRQIRFFYRYRRLVLKVAAKHSHLLTFYCDRQIQWNAYPTGVLPLIRDYYAAKRNKR